MADSDNDLPVIDLAATEGYIVDDTDEDDPVLLAPDGTPIDTWRENYPYQNRLTRDEYEHTKRALQIELLKWQNWTKDTGQRHIILFEGRDAAGKGGTIKRFNEHLNPRGARTVALEKPSPRESTSWYFQRYIQHLPAAGEIVIFDRSWYNRAGVEKVMGFATPIQTKRFMQQCPTFERMLVEDGIMLRKYWFSVSDEVQYERFRSRLSDPLRQWKLSPMDLESITRWEEYSRAKDEMLVHTDRPEAPWFQVPSDSKKAARLNMISHFLSTIPYEDLPDEAPIELPQRPPSTGYVRPPINTLQYVPDHAAEIIREARLGVLPQVDPGYEGAMPGLEDLGKLVDPGEGPGKSAKVGKGGGHHKKKAKKSK